MSFQINRSDTSLLAKWWWTVDRWMLGNILLLIGCGLLLVGAASPPVAERIHLDGFHFLIKHVIFLIPSLIMMFLISFCSQKVLKIFGVGLLCFALALTFLTLFQAESIKGARRWIGIGSFSLQPSEFLKPALILCLSWLLTYPWPKPPPPLSPNMFRFLLASGLLGVCLLPLLLQPDIGMSILLTLCWGAVLFLGGMPLQLLSALVLTGVTLLGIVVQIFPHANQRVQSFLNPATTENYQVDKALEAFQAGGIFGTGPGQGSVKFWIPDVHADFIYAVAAEEMGMIFAVGILLMYGGLLWRSFEVSRGHHGGFASLAIAGTAIQIGLQASIHIASTLHMMPTKGMTLPLMSYGGSSLFATCISCGILLALTRKTMQQPRFLTVK